MSHDYSTDVQAKQLLAELIECKNEALMKVHLQNLKTHYQLTYELWATAMLNQKFATQTGRRFNEMMTGYWRIDLVSLKEQIGVLI